MKVRLWALISIISIFFTPITNAEVSIFHPGKHKIKPKPHIPDTSLIQLGEPVTQLINIIFKPTSMIAFELIPVEDLTARKYKNMSVVALYKITSSQPTHLGVRWSYNEGWSTEKIIRLKGKGNNKHFLWLYIPRLASNNSLRDWGKDGWAVSQNSLTELKGEIRVFKDQAVPSDTYVVSLDASAFIS